VNTAHRGNPELAARVRRVVMVVEDEIWIRLMIADFLRDADFEVIECISADEAVDLLRGGTRVSIIFSDVQLPGSMDGVALAEFVHTKFPDRPVLLTSGNASQMSNVIHDGFFAKPYDPIAVVRRIKSLLE
jgi:CheY-like chemotaxis protein